MNKIDAANINGQIINEQIQDLDASKLHGMLPDAILKQIMHLVRAEMRTPTYDLNSKTGKLTKQSNPVDELIGSKK